MSNFLNYMHFPVFSVMVLFLGAFLIVVLGRNKYVRGVIAMLSVGAALACMLALIKPVMFNGEIISYWMGNRSLHRNGSRCTVTVLWASDYDCSFCVVPVFHPVYGT